MSEQASATRFAGPNGNDDPNTVDMRLVRSGSDRVPGEVVTFVRFCWF